MQTGIKKNGNQKKKIAILIPDKIALKLKTLSTDKEGHYIMKKRVNISRRCNIVNSYESNIGASKYIQQKLTELKG